MPISLQHLWYCYRISLEDDIATIHFVPSHYTVPQVANSLRIRRKKQVTPYSHCSMRIFLLPKEKKTPQARKTQIEHDDSIYVSFFFLAPLTFAVPRSAFCLFFLCLPIVKTHISIMRRCSG